MKKFIWIKEGEGTEDELAFRNKIKKSIQFAKTVFILLNRIPWGWTDHYALIKGNVTKDLARAYAILQRFEFEGVLERRKSRKHIRWHFTKDQNGKYLIEAYQKEAEEGMRNEGFEIKEEEEKT